MRSQRKKVTDAPFEIGASSQYRCLVIRLEFKPGGWAIFRLDEERWSLSVESDWGTYTYAWGAHARKEPFWNFLATCSTGYTSGKRVTAVVDGAATRTAFKRRARELWSSGRLRFVLDASYGADLFAEYQSLISEIHDYVRAVDDKPIDSFDLYGPATDLIMRAFGDDLYERVVTEMPSWHQVLTYRVIPAFQNYLRALKQDEQTDLQYSYRMDGGPA